MRKLFLVILLLSSLACLLLTIFYITSRATRVYGPPAASLALSQRIQYSALLLWYDYLLTKPRDVERAEQTFTIEQGESVNSVAGQLESAGLIRDAEAFRAYLIYSGLDTSIQAG